MKFSLFLLALLFVSVNMNAQGRGQRPAPPTAEERAKNLDELATKLELSMEQKTKAGEIEETFFADTQKARQSGDRESMREKMTALRDNRAKAMKEVLSAEQFKQWEEIQKARRQRRPGGRNR